MSKVLRDFPFLPYLAVFLTITFIPKYLRNTLTDSVLTSRRPLEENAPVNDFRRTVPSEKCSCKYNS